MRIPCVLAPPIRTSRSDERAQEQASAGHGMVRSHHPFVWSHRRPLHGKSWWGLGHVQRCGPRGRHWLDVDCSCRSDVCPVAHDQRHLHLHASHGEKRSAPHQLRLVYLIAIYIAMFVFFGAHAAKGLSQGRLVSADVHFHKCRVPVIRVEHYRDPQRCADGWRSPSRGSGRCSLHGGVSNRSERIESEIQKPEAMCWEKALNHSWID